MDYGKLAYFKTEELERKLSKSVGSKTSFGTYFTKVSNVSSGKLLSVKSGGEGAVIVRSPTQAKYFVNDLFVGEGKDVTFKFVGDATVSVETSEQIEYIELLIMGEFDDAEQVVSMQADISGDTIRFVTCNGEHVNRFSAGVTDFSPTLIGGTDGVCADVCAYKGEFLEALLTSDGTVHLISGESAYEYALWASKIAINAVGDEIALAYIKGGELFYFKVTLGDTSYAEKKVGYRGYIDDVRFVKGENKLVFSSKGNCYLTEI